MRPFLDQDFLLESETARWLYHDVAARQPIFDYHCHLPPAQIAADHRFANLTEIWLHGDHYKWRAMRACGVPEPLITGQASDREKFDAWAAVVPRTLRNPLYHWTHLELRDPFGLTGLLLGPDTAEEVWQRCNARLAEPGFSTQGLLAHFRVRAVCTTDDPIDDLAPHQAHARAAGTRTRLYPTWRADRLLAVDDPAAWNDWVDRLGQRAGLAIANLDDLRAALARRHEDFHRHGCRLSDHGLPRCHAADYTEADLRRTFMALRARTVPTPDDQERFRAAMLLEEARLHHARGWTQQLHLGALRNNNRRAFARLGRDAGYDSIGDEPLALGLQRFLDRLDAQGELPRTIVYNLNPRDNALVATMLGNFQGDVPGKLQFGAAWWFLDQRQGILAQLDDLSNFGLLSLFVGMLTDSRSFLSYSRHEYFRRLLCNLIGDEVERGLLPGDRALLSELVARICFGNARDYFGLDVGDA